jgi:molybdopterin-guanine dinucleotide biosynthesis protein A
LEWIIARLSPQVDRLLINANGDPARFAQFGLPVVPDDLPDRPGPLAGVLAALDWAVQQPGEAEWVLTVSGDAPFIPLDLADRLHEGRGDARLACAASGGGVHHTIGLWPLALRKDLRTAVAKEGVRKVEAYAARHSRAIIEWPTEPSDPFFNINRPEDLQQAERIAGRCGPTVWLPPA